VSASAPGCSSVFLNSFSRSRSSCSKSFAESPEEVSFEEEEEGGEERFEEETEIFGFNNDDEVEFGREGFEEPEANGVPKNVDGGTTGLMDGVLI
jgi:hypothetical protein